ncbi:MAG TPA: DUF1549 domain-containing protein, partial [Opitutaceae bacterium]|nr:DUF1549 domain-containing protein [Opitutaceae bacterium]
MFDATPGIIARFLRTWHFVIGFLLVASVGVAARGPANDAPHELSRVQGGTSPAQEKITFNQHIRPILSDNCFACHGTDAAHRKGELRLDTADGAMGTSKSGATAIIPGDLDASELWQRIISPHEDEVMPPPESHKQPLTSDQRELIRRWIEQGAAYQRHWAYEPVSRPEPPSALAGGSSHPVDQFIGAKLATKNLTLSREAPPEALLRRVTLDLTGLPPSPEEVDAYLSDSKPGAYERAVDRLLASSRFGEQFGRHWLDAVRYADTHGLHLDNVRSIWPYRDWVVNAFNRNMPFDQFTIEQLAGDMLPNPTVQQQVASGYNRNILTTSEAGAIESEVDMRNTAERVDTTAAVWMGMTANCASCHDHKFDPLTQKDYYSLGAIFKGLAERTWDANVLTPAPALIVAGDPKTQARIQQLDEDVKRLEAVVSAKADKITGNAPLPKYDPVPITYDVVWAEDSDMMAPSYLSRPPLPGEWRGGSGVPVMSGTRALRVEGAAERPIAFAAGDSIIMVRTSAVAFAHVYLDPVNPPRAVSLEFDSGEKTMRMVWGDPDAFGADVAKNSIRGGDLPAAGGYVRLSLSACDSGVDEGKLFTGIKLGQSGGLAWWDQIGATLTSPKASEDPLLSRTAWNQSIRRAWPGFDQVGMRNDLNFIVRINDVLRDADEIRKLDRWYRDYVYAPLRSDLESETHAVRALLAEQIHYETTLPMTMISKEREKPLPSHVLIRGQYDKPGELVEAATPAFLPPAPTTSGRVTRLDFAQWLVSPENPLTSRVTVNRLWGQLFGVGLVRTPADFGSQG